MAAESLFKDFQQRFKLFVSKRPDIVENTLSNIFTMRLIDNKTHGDMAEIGIAEFIHQFMYDFDSRHVGKDLFRAKYGAAVTDRKTKGRLHPMYMFLDGEGRYICEVRCGGTAANALQRGFWTHTINAAHCFDSLTNGWISYEHNLTLVQLFRLALNSTENGHKSANALLQTDIDNLKQTQRQ